MHRAMLLACALPTLSAPSARAAANYDALGVIFRARHTPKRVDVGGIGESWMDSGSIQG